MKKNTEFLNSLSKEKQDLLNAWAQTDRGSLESKNVYAVDDSWNSLSLIKSYLKGINQLSAHVFDNEFEALRAITKQSPDLIIMDINLLNLSGVKLHAMIANIHPLKIPTIFISGDSSAERTLKDHFGEIIFVPKPIRKDSLVKAIEKAMNLDLRLENSRCA